MSDRDRDGSGRPRSARPRDRTGRPLPRGAAGQAPGPDEPPLPPAEALRLAQRLLDDGLPFRAHEVLEAVWKASAADERELWRGLAQVAVGLTHHQRGNRTGAVALLRRGAERVAAWADRRPYGLDTAAVAGAARALADALEAGRADGPAVRLLPRRDVG